MHLNMAKTNLQDYITCQIDTPSAEESHIPLINFITEQLDLIQRAKQGRRYSADIIVNAFMWKLTSTSLYKKLQNFFILPSDCQLRRLSTDMNVESCRLDLDYLRDRTSSLTEPEKIVTLMLDEVYTAQRVEYTDGAFIGLTEEGKPAKTVLAFMVQSLHSKYKDVVCLIPVSQLDTGILRKWFDKVMEAIDPYLLVIAVSVDNHVCNRYISFIV